MNYTIKIDKIRQNLQLIKYDNLLQVVNNDNKKLLDKLITDKNSDNIIKKHNTINPFNENVNTLVDNVYRNEWKKLKPFHRKNRIDKYINDLAVTKSEKIKLKKKYFNMIKNKDKMTVKYDSDNGEIISIK